MILKVFILLLLTITLSSSKLKNRNLLKTKADNTTNITNISISKEIKAFCFLDVDGIIYDLLPLYDPSQDYFFKGAKDYYYFNLCHYGVTKCKKDNSYMVYTNEPMANQNSTATECYLMSGTNPTIPPKWKVYSIYSY